MKKQHIITISNEHWERCVRMRDVTLLHAQAEEFHMCEWCRGYTYGRPYISCHTPACVGGHACADPWHQSQGLYWGRGSPKFRDAVRGTALNMYFFGTKYYTQVKFSLALGYTNHRVCFWSIAAQHQTLYAARREWARIMDEHLSVCYVKKSRHQQDENDSMMNQISTTNPEGPMTYLTGLNFQLFGKRRLMKPKYFALRDRLIGFVLFVGVFIVPPVLYWWVR